MTAHRSPTLVALALGAAVVVLGAAGCSSDGDSAEPSTTTLEVALTEDPRYECEDATGDIEDLDAAEGATALADPAGIDLVSASVDRGEDELAVQFTVAGDIEATTAPLFQVFRGPPTAQGSFELQAVRADDGTWALYVVEYLTNIGERSRIDVPVAVDGATLSYVVPLALLPPVTGPVGWAFGSFDGDRDSVEDLDDPTTTAPPAEPVAPEPTTSLTDLCSPFDEAADAATTTTAG